MITYKVIILGDSKVGKTAFILRFCEDKFLEESLSTVGLDMKTKFVTRQNKKIQLQIWDTAGQERFRSITKNIYKGAHGILLMYDVTNKETFKHIKEWINNIRDNINNQIDKIALCVLGNKIDQPKEMKQVTEEDKQKFKDESNLDIMEVSAKSNININESIIELVDKMIELGVGIKKTDDDEEDGQKLQKIKTKKKKECCGGKKK